MLRRLMTKIASIYETTALGIRVGNLYESGSITLAEVKTILAAPATEQALVPVPVPEREFLNA